jgi:hypothetical protein
MQTTKMLCVACIFIVIRLNKYLPPIITYGCGAAAIAMVSMISLMLPPVAEMYESTVASIAKWNAEVVVSNNRDRKYLIRKYRALRPLRFYCGFMHTRFFMFDRSACTEFVMDIVNHLIDAMMAYPEKTIRAAFTAKQKL